MKKYLTPSIVFVATFTVLLAFALISVFIAGILTNKAFYGNVFFYGGSDIFMDYLNSVRDNAELNTYTDLHTIYPPLVAFYFHLMSKFVPDNILRLDFSQRYLMRSCAPAMIELTLFFLAFGILLYFSIRRLLRNERKGVPLMVFLLSLCAYPMLYAFERGNVLFASVVLLVAFFAFRDHEKAWVRELAILALALSISIKIYPVVFSLFLLKKKEFVAFAKTAVYSMLLFFVPFVIYGGAEGCYLLIRQIFTFSEGQTTNPFLSNVVMLLVREGALQGTAATVLQLVLALVMLVALFFTKEDYETSLVCFLAMMLLPGTAGTYSCAYALPCLLLLISMRHQWRALRYLPSLVLMLFLFGFYRDETFYFGEMFLAGSIVAALLLLVLNPIEALIQRKKRSVEHA